MAGGLRALGVGRGDRVVAYMPNIPETLIAFLATASLGAIWSSAAPEFGARSVIDRFAQIEPKVLLAVDGYRHGGKDFDRRAVVAEILAELPTVSDTVLVPYLFEHACTSSAEGLHLGGAARARRGRGADASSRCRSTIRCGCSTPRARRACRRRSCTGTAGSCWSSSRRATCTWTCSRGDRMFWFTTTGWMMWNFLIGCLFTEAAVVLYDGSPAHPDLGALWELARAHADDVHGGQRGPAGGLREGGLRARPRLRPGRAARDRLDRLAAGAGELSLGLPSM